MLRNLWGKLTGTGDAAKEHEAELEQMSPDERRFASESMEDIAADNMASDRYGGGAPRGSREITTRRPSPSSQTEINTTPVSVRTIPARCIGATRSCSTAAASSTVTTG